MKNTLLTLLAATAVLTLNSLPALGADGWLDNYDKALAQAKAEKKLLLAEFTGSDWCPPCKKQAAEVFGSDEFKKFAGEKLVLLQLDFPRSKPQSDDLKAQNKKLSQQFAVRGYPTVIMLDGEGKELARWVGYGGGGPGDLISKINALQK